MIRNCMRCMVISFFLVFSAVTVQADEILEALTEATEAYKEKAYTEALESLDYAKQLILQMSSEGLMQFLPEPLDGWNAREAKQQNLGMLGGSSGVEREYQQTAGGSNGRITIAIMGESPLFTGMMAMFNPAIAGADGGKLQKIKRNKAIVKYSTDNQNGEILINVAKRYIVTVKGYNVAKEDMLYYAESVNYKGLKTLQ